VIIFGFLPQNLKMMAVAAPPRTPPRHEKQEEGTPTARRQDQPEETQAI
jgi:hypothetical protein